MASEASQKQGDSAPLLRLLNQPLLEHQLLLHLGHMAVAFDAFCVVVWWPLPGHARLCKPLYCHLCRSFALLIKRQLTLEVVVHVGHIRLRRQRYHLQ